MYNRKDKLKTDIIQLEKNDDDFKWKHFPRYWPFVRGIHLIIYYYVRDDTNLFLLMIRFRQNTISYCSNIVTSDTQQLTPDGNYHYNDIIMGAKAFQITSLTIVFSTVYLDTDQRTSKLRVTGLCVGNSPEAGEFPAQMASNAENVSIWWRHHY